MKIINNDTIITNDGKYWLYDDDNQEWIDVSPNPKLSKLCVEV